jgi:hypothetical protein
MEEKMHLVGYQTMPDTFLSESISTKKTHTKWSWLQAGCGILTSVGAMVGLAYSSTNRIAQLCCGVLSGAGVMSSLHIKLPTKWSYVVLNQLFEHSKALQFAAVQAYLNVENEEEKLYIFNACMGLLGMQLASLFLYYKDRHKNFEKLLKKIKEENIHIQLKESNDLTDTLLEKSKIELPFRTTCWQHIITTQKVLVVGAFLFSGQYIKDPFWEKFANCAAAGIFMSIFGHKCIKKIEEYHTRLTNDLHRMQQTQYEDHGITIDSQKLTSKKLKALHLFCDSFRYIAPMIIGGLFVDINWVQAGAIGFISGAEEESYAHEYTTISANKYYAQFNGFLNRKEKKGVWIFETIANLTKFSALIWFDYRVFTDKGARPIDRLNMGMFSGCFITATIASVLVQKIFVPTKSCKALNLANFCCNIKSDRLMYPYLYSLHAGIKIGDEGVNTSMQYAMIPATIWGCLGASYGLKGNDRFFRMLLTEWAMRYYYYGL